MHAALDFKVVRTRLLDAYKVEKPKAVVLPFEVTKPHPDLARVDFEAIERNNGYIEKAARRVIANLIARATWRLLGDPIRVTELLDQDVADIGALEFLPSDVNKLKAACQQALLGGWLVGVQQARREARKVVVEMSTDWDEAKHPRDKQGKFTLSESGYHVTLTEHVQSIRERGIIPKGAPSNWVKAGNRKRYGKGDVYAFENRVDALRWAAKWDWELTQSFGSGKVSIVEFKDGKSWVIDDADPLSQAGSEGLWLKRGTAVLPEDISSVQPFTEKELKEWQKARKFAADWDEDEHPRDKDGKFAPKGSADQSGGAESSRFDPAAWRGKPMGERRSEWGKLAPEEKDRLADPAISVDVRADELLGDADRAFPDTGNPVDDIAEYVDELTPLIASEARSMLVQYGTEMHQQLEVAGVKPEAARELALELTRMIAAQDIEAAGRTLGDHGVHHILQDQQLALDVLTSMPGYKADPKAIAAVTVAIAIHDAGYLTPPGQQFLDDRHPVWSSQYFEANYRPMVEAALGKEQADFISMAIASHDGVNIDWEKYPELSAVRMADNMALFHFEKMPPLIRYAPNNMKPLIALGQGRISVDAAKAMMRSNVERANLSPALKSRMLSGIDEVSAFLPKFTVGMVGAKLDRVEWGADHPSFYITRRISNEALSKVLDLGQGQFRKLAETYKQDPDEFLRTGRLEARDRAGRVLFDATIERAAREAMARAFEDVLRFAEWREEDHPRAKDGKFEPAGGAAGGHDQQSHAGNRGGGANSGEVSSGALDKLYRGFDTAPRTEGIAEAEDAWNGGVADFGDRDAAYLIQNMPGYFDYRSALEETAREVLGESFTVYRLMSAEQLAEWKNTGDVGPVAVSLSKSMASAFRGFAGFRGRDDLVLVEMVTGPGSIVMAGKEAEKELVIDSGTISGHELREIKFARLAFADWREEDHPRASDGKFAPASAGDGRDAGTGVQTLEVRAWRPTDEDRHSTSGPTRALQVLVNPTVSEFLRWAGRDVRAVRGQGDRYGNYYFWDAGSALHVQVENALAEKGRGLGSRMGSEVPLSPKGFLAEYPRVFREEKFSRLAFATDLRENAAGYFEANGFRMAQNLSDGARAIIQQELTRAVRTGDTRSSVTARIYDRLLTRGFTDMEGIETEVDDESVLADLLDLSDADAVPHYIDTMVRTNVYEAMNEARFAEFTDPDLDGYVVALEYSAILDENTTEFCRYMDGRKYAVDNPIWDTHRPPNHYNCRSVLIPITVLSNWDGVEDEPPAVDPAVGFVRCGCNAHVFAANPAAVWEEEEHPRAADGKFAPKATASERLVGKLKTDGGFTYIPAIDGSPIGGFAVAMYPAEGEIIRDRAIEPADIDAFRERHAEVLGENPNNAIGGWYNPDNGAVYLDISRVVASKDEAVRLGDKQLEESIYDLGTGETVWLPSAQQSHRAYLARRARALSVPARRDVGADRGSDQRDAQTERGWPLGWPMDRGSGRSLADHSHSVIGAPGEANGRSPLSFEWREEEHPRDPNGQFASSVTVITVRPTGSESSKELSVIINPTASALKRWAGREVKDVRYLVDADTGDAYVWDASDAIHEEVIKALVSRGHDNLIGFDGSIAEGVLGDIDAARKNKGEFSRNARVVTFEWREEDHPRDREGQFAPSGSSGGVGHVLNSLPVLKSADNAQARAWRAQNEERYKNDPEFKAVIDAVTLFTQGEYDFVRGAVEFAETGVLNNKIFGPSWQERINGPISGNGLAEYKSYFESQGELHDGTGRATWREAGAALGRAVDSAPPSEGVIYRGLPSQEAYNTAYALKPGDTFEIKAPASFTASAEIADKFAAGRGGKGDRAPREGSDYQTIIEIEPGHPALNVSMLSPWRQQEVLARGKFKVVDVKVEPYEARHRNGGWMKRERVRVRLRGERS